MTTAASRFRSTRCRLPMILSLSLVMVAGTTTLQAQSASSSGAGSSDRATSSPADTALLDPNDAIILLLDHQTGLFQTVKDVPVADLRANTVVLARIGEQAKVPILITASEPNGPNGPIMSELAAATPNSKYIGRKGEVSAWDNEDFRNAVRNSGKKTLIMAGVWTSVCVAFPALQAKAEGYKVYAVMDASGDMSEMASRATMERMSQAGIIPVTTNVILCEFQRTWARPDAAQWGALYNALVPHYNAVFESYKRAQDAAKGTVQQPAKP